MKQFRDTDYYVTENGEVYRLWKSGFKKKKPQLKDNGYLQISFYKNGVEKNYRINRLVAECYIPNPDNLPEVNHNDGNKSNNNVSNLYWCTRSQNMKHAYDNNLLKPPIFKGENNFKSKLTTEDIIWIRKHYIPRHPEFSQSALAKKFNIEQATISDIVNRITWKHITPEQSSES